MGRFVLGVTGAIAAGKSTVCRVLEKRGWSVLDVDEVAAEVLFQVLPAIVQKVPSVLSAAGALNKEPLFAAMLSDPGFRHELESLLRPYVLRRVDDWAASLTGPGALDAALLFESGLDKYCDTTLCVQCSPQVRRQRAQERSTASAQHFDALQAAQWPEADKLARADLTVSTEAPLAELEDSLLEALGTSLATGFPR